MKKLQRENLEELSKRRDREYLDSTVMPALYLSLQKLLQERYPTPITIIIEFIKRPERPLRALAEMLANFDENPPSNPLLAIREEYHNDNDGGGGAKDATKAARFDPSSTVIITKEGNFMRVLEEATIPSQVPNFIIKGTTTETPLQS